MGNSSNISTLKKAECCGCRACGNVCPKNCISFSEDTEGFFYPEVDERICISCGKCRRVCPELNLKLNPEATEAYAAYAVNGNDRQAGSSGGLFGLMACRVIKNDGNVLGAAFDEELKLKHMEACDYSQVGKLCRSKYLQSDMSDAFSAVKASVDAGRLTLFSGTPCQCNAVRNFVGDNDCLITSEVVCHGVPSQSLFDKSLRWIERKQHCKIEDFQFRSKYKGALHPHAFSYVMAKNGKRRQVNGLHYQMPFYFGFQKYITLRPSCYECKWARHERSADITLGDFWGIEKYDAALDSKQGVSLVILNSPKGHRVFKTLVDNSLIFSESLPIQAAYDNNGCLVAPTRLKPERSRFFEALQTEDFDSVVQQFLIPRRKLIFDAYYGLPGPLRRIVRRIMDKRMKYE